MKKYKITIVTVTYNVGKLLEATVNSIINQTYNNIEYIIIDGASTDETVNIIKKYEDKISYWISEPDEGIYFAMNKAIKKASGEWINFMNAGDTFVDITTLQKVINSLDNDTELIYGDHICDDVIGRVKERKITRSMPCCHQSLLVRTSLMKQTPYNTFYKISADYEFLLKMYQQGKKFQYVKIPVANYLRNGFSDKNTVRWYLEVLTILMNNNVDLEEIIKSPAYNLIENKKFKQLQKNYDELLHKYNDMQNGSENIKTKYKLFMTRISKLTKIRVFKNLFQKFKDH